ncbi:type IV pilus assembly protein PilM [Crenobacter sp. SG2305]|uniref:type IV pilus assembly protein PilM n=1 Tax=Crenobacter oryzisoli TaxID=3056844 RepID=UPI0025AACE59|nr:type IV pilus assembly protein PilM [Crenobacter sp. SG2305]MDN0084101.1 type IV pilus assembly protein PilM [Crenobacter sp. SG2305]
MLRGKISRLTDWLSQLATLSPTSGPLLGLDLGCSAIKLVELSHHDQIPKLERYLIESLPSGIIVDGNLVDLEQAAHRVRAAWERLGTPTRDVAIALPTTQSIHKTLRLPASSHDQLAALVHAAAGRLIPFPLDEVNLDFQVLGPSPGQTEETEVLVCAARRERVEERVALAELAGLRPRIVDVEAFATIRPLDGLRLLPAGQDHAQTVALFDLSGHKLRCHVVRDGVPLYFREQALGGIPQPGLPDQSDYLNWTAPESTEHLPALPAWPQPPADTVAQEVARALQLFASTVSGQHYHEVDAILLSGGTSRLPGLAAAVTEVTRLNARLANPFAAMTVAPTLRPRTLHDDAPVLLTASGLALRGMAR